MSITKDFENNHDGNAYNTFAVDQLLAHSRALEAMLKKYQWGTEFCPECGAIELNEWDDELEDLKPVGKHGDTCQLSKLLEGVD